MSLFDNRWTLDGAKPPKWLMKEFSKALQMMGKNREAVHLFDADGPAGNVTFVIAIGYKSSSEEMARRISIALDADIQPGEISARVIESKGVSK